METLADLYGMVDPGRVSFFGNFFLSSGVLVGLGLLALALYRTWRIESWKDKLRAAEGPPKPRFGLCRRCSTYGPLEDRLCEGCRTNG